MATPILRNKKIDYKIFDQAGFDAKACSVIHIDVPNFTDSSIQEVYQTGSPGPLRYHVSEKKTVVDFYVEFKPFANAGEKLIAKAKELVEDVLDPKYKPEPVTISSFNKDRSLDKNETVNINDTIIRKATIKVNRRDEKKGEPGFVRILFHLQGLLAKPK